MPTFRIQSLENLKQVYGADSEESYIFSYCVPASWHMSYIAPIKITS